jgi:uroporphyrinogen III methyltransferase/synthase
VLYDYLVNPAILEHVSPTAERICLGQHGRTRIWTQAEIDAELVARARAGKTVVRLKGGDPVVFAHMAEETDVLVRHGIEFEVVPGITAALAAAAYAGVPITHRELASAVAFVAGQEGGDKEGPSFDYRRLAQFPGTLVIYMGVTTAPHWTAELLEAGMSADTPALIVRKCSLPDQQSVRCTLGELTPHLVPATRMRPPVVVILGAAAGLAACGSWFERRPLFGQTVLVTRPAHQAQELAGPLAELGARVVLQPAIEIRAPQDWSAADAAMRRLSDFDWLVFSSANGVQAVMRRLQHLGLDLRALGRVKLAAIGPATSETLADFHLRADLRPARFQAEDLAAALVSRAAGQRFLLARASRGREVLAEELQAAGGRVEQMIVYESADVSAPNPDVLDQLRGGHVDWVTVTSSAIARSLWKLFGEELNRAKLVSISPLTSATLRELGLQPAAEAREATIAGVIAAICQR